MNMQSVYWLTRLATINDIGQILFVLAFVFFILYFIGFLLSKADSISEIENAIEAFKEWRLIAFIVLLVSLAICMIFPTSSQIHLMIAADVSQPIVEKLIGVETSENPTP